MTIRLYLVVDDGKTKKQTEIPLKDDFKDKKKTGYGYYNMVQDKVPGSGFDIDGKKYSVGINIYRKR